MRKLPSLEDKWEDVLPGLRVCFRPIGRKAWRAARRAAGRVLADAEGNEPDDVLEDAGDELSFELLYRGIVAWEGVGDDDEQPVEPTLDKLKVDEEGKTVIGEDGRSVVEEKGTISRFLADPIVFQACDRAYVTPFVAREKEKNGSSASPSGTGEAGTQAGDTATSAAPPAPAPAAKRAHTKSTTPRQREGRSSGK